MTQELGPGLEPQGAPQYVPGIPAVQTGASPVWSPNGETLTFLVGREIREWTVGGTARGVYSTPLLPQGFDMSWRDGRARGVIALSVANLDIWALPVDPTSHTAVGAAVVRIDSTAAERAQSFSPDGRKLAFTSAISGTGQLWLANADGSERRQLTHLPQPVMSSTQWSPDGRQIAFPVVDPAGGDLITNVIDVEGGLPRPLFKGYVNDWSADGQYLYAFRLGAPEMTWRARVADGALEELFHGGGTVETVDGVELLYSKNNHFGIFARALAGDVAANPERKLLDDYYPARGDIVPVEDGFYYVRHTDGGEPRAFGFYEYATQRAHDVAPAPKSVDIGMTVSPDGEELLYSAWGPGSDFDLKVLEFDVR
jgi:hypothetical protein